MITNLALHYRSIQIWNIESTRGQLWSMCERREIFTSQYLLSFLPSMKSARAFTSIYYIFEVKSVEQWNYTTLNWTGLYVSTASSWIAVKKFQSDLSSMRASDRYYLNSALDYPHRVWVLFSIDRSMCNEQLACGLWHCYVFFFRHINYSPLRHMQMSWSEREVYTDAAHVKETWSMDWKT